MQVQSKILDGKALYVFMWLCMSAIVALVLSLFASQEWLKAVIISVVVLPTALFLGLSGKRIPQIYVAVFVAVSLFNVICISWGLYKSFEYMDDIAHFATGFALVPCCSHALLHPLLDGALKDTELKDRALFALLGTALGLAVGALWEIFEFMLSIEATYADTMTDLIFDAAGAGVAAVWMSGGLEERVGDKRRKIL